MEKAGLLITRLLELYNNKAGNNQLRITTQLLLSELEKAEEKDQSFQSVAVFFPAAHSILSNSSEEPVIIPEPQEKNVIVEAEPDVSQKKNIASPQEDTAPIKAEPEPAAKAKNGENNYNYFNPMVEIPTLALKQQEVNETIAARQESLNDTLKSSYKEIAHNIADGPIKDLRKGIGVNDQYLFINELFRGDQTMYDRSIKTINSFNIYGEAELWIKRELKLKLGWNESSKASVLFDQLVRRRFS
jgi:hypothetical protein